MAKDEKPKESQSQFYGKEALSNGNVRYNSEFY